MIIKSTVCKDSNGNDMLKLACEPEVAVILTESSGAEQLKTMFMSLLQGLLTDDITVEFDKTQNYTNGMYEEICKEYISSLNRELVLARERIVSEGLSDH